MCNILWENDNIQPLNLDPGFISQIGLDKLILNNSMNSYKLNFENTELNLSEYFTKDYETIKNRQDMFLELVDNPKLYDDLKKITPLAYDIKYINIANSMATTTIESNLFSVKELSLYIELIDHMAKTFNSNSVTSKYLIRIKEKIESIVKDEKFINLKQNAAFIIENVSRIKSVTIGMNLDPNFVPYEAGVIAVNSQPFVSGKLIDKLLKGDLKEKNSSSQFECLSPLDASCKRAGAKEKEILKNSIHESLYNIFSKSVSSWGRAIKSYSLIETEWILSICDQLRFITNCVDFLRKLKNNCLPLCKGELSLTEESLTGLYNPLFAIDKINHNIVNGIKIKKSPVLNDFSFDDKGRIYILTGPNQGGKSVFLSAVGFAYAMFHLGLPIAAKSAKLKMVDNILVYYPTIDNTTFTAGRLGTECENIKKISNLMTANSLFLFDEAFSSTSGTEGEIISKDVIQAFSEIGVRGIYATHIHSLQRCFDDFNNTEYVNSKIDYLSSDYDKVTEQRTFIIKRKKGDGESYAQSIIKKYKIDKDSILENRILNTKK